MGTTMADTPELPTFMEIAKLSRQGTVTQGNLARADNQQNTPDTSAASHLGSALNGTLQDEAASLRRAIDNETDRRLSRGLGLD